MTRCIESLPGHECNLGALEDECGEFGRRGDARAVDLAPQQARHVGEGVERPARSRQRETFDLAEHVDHCAASPIERFTHCVERFGGARQRGDGGALGNVVDVRGQVALEPRNALGDVRRSDQPADAPAGHGERLGDAVDEDRAVLELGHHVKDRMERRAVINKVLINLIGEHPQIVLESPPPELFHLGAAHDRTRRVRRRAQQHDLRTRRAGGLELLDRGDIALVGARAHGDGNSARKPNCLRIRCPVGRWQDGFIARIEERCECFVYGLLPAVGDDDA